MVEESSFHRNQLKVKETIYFWLLKLNIQIIKTITLIQGWIITQQNPKIFISYKILSMNAHSHINNFYVLCNLKKCIESTCFKNANKLVKDDILTHCLEFFTVPTKLQFIVSLWLNLIKVLFCSGVRKKTLQFLAGG